MKVSIVSEQEVLNELFGFGTTGKSKKIDPQHINNAKQFLQTIQNDIDELKLAPTLQALKITTPAELYQDLGESLGLFNGSKGSVQALSVGKADVIINRVDQDVKYIEAAFSAKKLNADIAEMIIAGYVEIINLFLTQSLSKQSVLSPMSEQQLNELLGMQTKKLNDYLTKLRGIQKKYDDASTVQGDSGIKGVEQQAQQANANGGAPAKRVPIFKASKESGGDVLSMRLKQVLNNYPVLKGLNKQVFLTSLLKMISNQLRANSVSISEAKGDNLSAQLGGFRSKNATGLPKGAAGPANPNAAGSGANLQKGSIDVFGPAVMLLKQNKIDQKNAVIVATKIKDIVLMHLKKHGVNLDHKRAAMPKPQSNKQAQTAQPAQTQPTTPTSTATQQSVPSSSNEMYEDEFRNQYPNINLKRIKTGTKVQVDTPNGKVWVKGGSATISGPSQDELDRDRERLMGNTVDETLKENLIPRKKEVLFSEIDAKRFKLLAGLL